MTPVDVTSIRDFVDGVDSAEATLLVLNRTQPVPILNLLSKAFDQQPIHIVDEAVPGPVTDDVVLLDESGVVADSDLGELADAFLLINADRYRSGPNDLSEVAVPAVLRELTDIGFDLRGYPASNKEKLLLVVMSRYIEARALRVDGGELRVGFQRLSRFDDEYGTRQVYRMLGDSGVDTHIYGVGAARTDYPDGVVVHEDDSDEYRKSWFLTFQSSTDSTDDTALVAWETGDNVWNGFWTFDAGRTARVADYVRRAF